MSICVSLNALKEKFEGLFNLATHFRNTLGEDHKQLSDLINASRTLSGIHWALMNKSFCPHYAYELLDVENGEYRLKLKVINGVVNCKKEIVLTFDTSDNLLGFETNFPY